MQPPLPNQSCCRNIFAINIPHFLRFKFPIISLLLQFNHSNITIHICSVFMSPCLLKYFNLLWSPSMILTCFHTITTYQCFGFYLKSVLWKKNKLTNSTVFSFVWNHNKLIRQLMYIFKYYLSWIIYFKNIFSKPNSAPKNIFAKNYHFEDICISFTWKLIFLYWWQFFWVHGLNVVHISSQ